METLRAGLGPIGIAVRDALDAEFAASDDIHAARRALMHWATRPGAGNQSPFRRRPGGLAALISTYPGPLSGAVGLAGGAIAVWLWWQSPISFDVGSAGVSVPLGDRISADGKSAESLHFSEGSSIVLEPGGRLRVLTVESAGARVLLESGTAQIAVQHRRWGETRWEIEAGPFRIHVVGTEFGVNWNPETQTLALSATQGSVRVSGGCLAEPRAVGIERPFQISCPSPDPKFPVSWRPDPEGSRLLALPAEVPSTPAQNRPSPLSAGAPSGRSIDADSVVAAGGSAAGEWKRLLVQGELSGALRAAEISGFESVFGQALPQELLTLADTARLSGRARRATEILTQLRRRHPRTPESTIAAFALGKIAFEQQRSFGEAVRWFSTYLHEAPQGPLMGDAAGRLMEARHRQGDLPGAQADAARYLRRFPKGPYAVDAQHILSERSIGDFPGQSQDRQMPATHTSAKRNQH